MFRESDPCNRLNMRLLLRRLAEARAKNRPVYRPRNANFLTRPSDIVNLMAISDHVFGCFKFQFCTVQNPK